MQNISVKNIYWMLAYAFRTLDEKGKEKISSEPFDNIYDLFAVMMIQELSKQIKRGLNKEYIINSDELSTIKGKIKIDETIKSNSHIRNKLICEFDEYSSNSYLNCIVKTACHYLIISNKISDINNIKKLKKLMIYLNDIDLLDKKTINWSQIRYNKNNVSYKMLTNISYLIIDGLLMNKENGTIEFKNYVDDQKMHKLYEKFILEYYRYHYKELRASVQQVAWNIEDKDNNPFIELLPKMQTDITLYYHGRTLIIDAKYYSNMYQNNPLFNKDTFKSNNLYQIYTYVKNEDKKKNGKVSGMLLYAKTDYNDNKWAEYNMDGNKIIISNLDLSDTFETVKEHLNLIAEKFINEEI